ncbi:MAG: tetratricopeptide repeat protein, partial [Sinobacteraceae bacterium]|nr:tetratricopeptide repeat protein [Nevskiaceae bacterium]
MLFEWLDAREAVEAASALADTFPAAVAGGEAIRKFLPQALREVRSRKLNFYKRAKFANALKWRLLENGVQAETASEVTQTLLLVSATEPPQSAAAPPPAPEPARKASDTAARQAEEAYSRGAYLEAIEHYTRLVSLRPGDAEALNNLGATLSKLGRYPQAEVQFRKALARRPNYP